MTHPEILTAIKSLEAKLSREPSSFNWTDALSAVFPARLTMSQLLAIWNAMHESAVYSGPGEAEADPDGWIANDNLAKPEWLGDDVKIDVKTRYLGQCVNHIRAGHIGWGENGASTIVKWRLS